MKITFKYHYQYKDYQFEIDSIGFSNSKDSILVKFNSIIEHINDLNRFIRADVQTIEINSSVAFSNVSEKNEKTYIQNINYYELTQNSGDDGGNNYIYFFFNKRKLYMKNYMSEYRKNNSEKIKEIKAKSYLKNKK